MTVVSTSLLVFSLPVVAYDEESAIFGDIETVSIATGREQPIVTAPAVASVFKANDIKNSGARNLTDILNMVPGIHIGVATISYSPIYSVRGFSSAFGSNILIMVDGIPQDDLAFSSSVAALEKVPIDIIERVEVSRGPGSALWGANAFSAVVNIITKSEIPDVSKVTVSGGSYDTRNARLLTGTNLFGFDIVAAFEHSNTDGLEPTIARDQQSLLDEQLGTHASLAPGKAATGLEETGVQINLSDEHSKLGLRAYHVVKDIGIGMAASLDPFGNNENNSLDATYQYNNDINQSFSVGVNLAYSQSDNTLDNLHIFPPGAFGVFPDGVIINEENRQNYTRLNTAFRYSGFQKHYLTLGLGGERDKIEEVNESRNYTLSNGTIIPTEMRDTFSEPILGMTDYSRNLKFVYLQDEWAALPDWNLTWGVRYDDYSDFGSVASQRLVLQWNTTYALTTKLLYGRGYRSPTIMETQSVYLPPLIANPALQPEKLDQVQLVFDYRPLQDIRGRVDLFYHKTDDQIRYQNSTSGPTFRPENVGDQIGRGLELELWWNIAARTKLYTYYTYQENIDKTTNKDAGYTPHHKLYAMLQHERPDGWFFSSKVTYVGSRDRIAEDIRSKADTYAFVDLLARKEITHKLEATLEIRNIFNEKAEEAGFGTAFPGDMPLPGRNYYMTFSAGF
jgi:outer membrane receptor protein involved in Fe transport